MPNPFSESSYALALSCELLGWSRATQALAAYPVVPKLQQEADLGYDLSLAMNWAVLFLQFKVPQRLHGANAGQMHHFGRPYFRFPVKTHRTANNAIQHNTLLQLEQQRSADALVYYSTPIFAQASNCTTPSSPRRSSSDRCSFHPRSCPPSGPTTAMSSPTPGSTTSRPSPNPALPEAAVSRPSTGNSSARFVNVRIVPGARRLLRSTSKN